ncbi:MAG: ORF6N domain-containing protein [Terracidiphilus sp.]
MNSESALVPYSIENQIVLVRGQKVLLDTDLAALYDVEVKALNQAVKRNEERFPPDFVFQLTAEENESLRSQFVTSKSSRGGRRYAPYAFTEHGAIMAASVLNSPRAVEMSIFVVRAFLRLRETLATNKALAAKLAELEQRLETTDQKILEIVEAIHVLAMPPERPARQIGFRPDATSKPKRLEANTVRVAKMRRGIA